MDNPFFQPPKDDDQDDLAEATRRVWNQLASLPKADTVADAQLRALHPSLRDDAKWQTVKTRIQDAIASKTMPGNGN